MTDMPLFVIFVYVQGPTGYSTLIVKDVILSGFGQKTVSSSFSD